MPLTTWQLSTLANNTAYSEGWRLFYVTSWAAREEDFVQKEKEQRSAAKCCYTAERSDPAGDGHEGPFRPRWIRLERTLNGNKWKGAGNKWLFCSCVVSGGYSGNELTLKRGLGLRRVYTHKNWQIMVTLTGRSISPGVNNMQYYAARLK